MDLFERLDAARNRWDVLRHPFYRRWSDGALTREELAWYAGEYRHAVVALAEQTEACAAVAAEPELSRDLTAHAAEESAHVALWDDFARGFPEHHRRPPRRETADCAAAWTAGETLAQRLSILYAIEASQPAISATKLEGLTAHYGLAPDEKATAYFALHAERDHDHAAQSRRLIAERDDGAGHDRLVELGAAALRGNWKLLDGVEVHFAAAA